jgi:hypothetical protein
LKCMELEQHGWWVIENILKEIKKFLGPDEN